MLEPLLLIRSLSKSFGPVHAVRDLDLTVLEGDVYGFLGLNGAGKTTTIRMVLGLLRPDAGSVTLMGSSDRRPSSREGLGALVEGPAFFGRLTGLQNLLYLGRISGEMTREEARRLLGRVGLDHAADRAARTYSLGMKQRLGIALALAAHPRLVILDEPTNGLDPQGIRDIRELLLSLNREEGMTLMISSHLLSEIEMTCNRVGIIHDGSMMLEDEVDVLMRKASRRVRMIVDGAEQAGRLLRERLGVRVIRDGHQLFIEEADTLDDAEAVALLVGSGVKVREYTRERLSLEEVFLERVPDEEDPE